MKIIFHERYYNANYAMDPAASAGRLEGIMKVLSKKLKEMVVLLQASKMELFKIRFRKLMRNVINLFAKDEM